MDALALSPDSRRSALASAGAGELDVVVIGGGVVGAGVALDAVTRGLSVALFEGRDWASGTSSRSSKLVHGGLRYLEMLDFRLVREALRERSLHAQRLAPHLVRPVPFLYPLRHRGWERLYAGAGVALYDTMGISFGAARALPRHRHLTRRGALRLAPSLRKDALVGAIQYYDAQVDDARHTMAVVRTAASYGALVANRARVLGFLREGERVTGVRVRDLESNTELEVRARQVVNATGVWTDETQAMVGERGQFHVRASKGVHLVVPRDRIQSRTGLILRTGTSVLFVIPWARHWIIGTTDTDWNLGKAHPAASRTDIDYLLDRVNRVLLTPLTREDVEGVYAGLRPLLSRESEHTSDLSREHTVAHPVPGLVVVAGGKYTTYRVMAEDAVDAVAHGLDERIPASCTNRVPLVGAEGYPALWNAGHRLAARHGLHVARVEHLLQRHGTLVHEVLALIDHDRTLADPLPGAEDYLRAEIVYAATHEARATSTTSSPAAPASPLKPSTAASPPHPTPPLSSPPFSAGASRRPSGRSSTTSRGSRRSGSRRSSPTTRRPTPPASVRPRSCQSSDDARRDHILPSPCGAERLTRFRRATVASSIVPLLITLLDANSSEGQRPWVCLRSTRGPPCRRDRA